MRSDTWPFGDVFEWVPLLGAIPAEQLEGTRPLHRVTRDSANALTALPDVGQPGKDVCVLDGGLLNANRLPREELQSPEET